MASRPPTFTLARYNTGGSLDPSFDAEGKGDRPMQQPYAVVVSGMR